MSKYVLKASPTKDDDSWSFNNVPPSFLLPGRTRAGKSGKFVRFTAEAITLQIAPFPSNRILHNDDQSNFVLCSFGDFRLPESNLRAMGEYIARFLKTGLFLNGVQYRFYHHSNSQLRGRSCFLRKASSDVELDAIIYQLGDFARIMNVAKRAKRIGLLFSEAQVDYQLDPQYVADIPDLKAGDEIFSDGCGLISKRLAIQVSKKKKVIFRGMRYTPCVYQIRYLGYKGVLMLHPELKEHLAEFRQSMKKFSTTTNATFSVVDYSKPYAFGRLNNDIIVLLGSLGITNERLLAKQASYLQRIAEASTHPLKAVDFLSAMDEYPLAEKVLLDGLNDPQVQAALRRLQLKEIADFRNDRNKSRSRMIIEKSRLLFGVCDPFKVLKEGEVHIRISTGRGATTPIHGNVLVVRNPCLHPGDCLKLRAAHHEKLNHLVDCIVFASVARPGRHAAPSMSSGGDLDGDKYFVCWDPDLVPPVVAESYDYPPNREKPNRSVTRADLVDHFAFYNNASLARIAALHSKWVRASPQGAMCSECQELNALHSQSVDGASVKIPDRLTAPPEPTEPYILDLLADAAQKFAEEFSQTEAARRSLALDPANLQSGQQLLDQLLLSQHTTISEYELFNLAWSMARKYKFDLKPFLNRFDFGAFTAQQKHAIISTLNLPNDGFDYIWSSLFRSDILTRKDLYDRCLNHPFSIQRLYSSNVQGLPTFFKYLKMATEQFTRRILILKTDDRFSVGIFMKGEIPWYSGDAKMEKEKGSDEDPVVHNNVVLCSFLSHTSATFSTYYQCTKDYRLHCSDVNLQLYDKNRGNTFVFLTTPPKASGAEVVASIALQKFSTRVQRQIGRLNRTPIIGIEIHVVSNRDRIAHQLFDLWFEHVPTELTLKRFERERVPYHANDVADIDWEVDYPLGAWLKNVYFTERRDKAGEFKLIARQEDDFKPQLEGKTPDQLDQVLEFALKYHLDDELFWAFTFLVSQEPLRRDQVLRWMDSHPPLAFVVLRKFPPSEEMLLLPPEVEALARNILVNIIRSANSLGIASLVALEKMTGNIVKLPSPAYLDLLWLAALSVRPMNLVQEIMLVLNDCRAAGPNANTNAARYEREHGLGIAIDRAEEAADECPCDDEGKPRRQRTAPAHTKLKVVQDEPMHVAATLRVDSPTPIRLHSHVRLQAASKADNRWVSSIVIDGVVVGSQKGELKIELMYPPPPEMESMDWNLYHAGSTATSKAMMDAVIRLLSDKEECCGFYRAITGDIESAQGTIPTSQGESASTEDHDDELDNASLNPSQIEAVRSCDEAPLTLIWGPPGTGKTTVVVQILRRMVEHMDKDTRILMTASTHNAVDNVLERFVALNKEKELLAEEQILRVATDTSKVNKNLQHYTIDARVGGDMNENNRLYKVAKQRLDAAKIAFTTCAGAGLGILRKAEFEIALIDEASQINEPCALIPLVKGVKRAVLVGDHVQLRPTVKNLGRALQFDVSLLERLYTKGSDAMISKTMLDIQYRFPQELAQFPSQEFYEGRLRSGIQDSQRVLGILGQMQFPWPTNETGGLIPTVFVDCSTEEDMGGMSKSNTGQVELVEKIIPLLRKARAQPQDSRTSPVPSEPAAGPSLETLNIVILSPYNKQITELRHRLPSSISCYTVDSFQGRESDIVIFSSVRSNAEGEIGFLDDARRLNVMWTRPRLALIIIGDKRTMSTNALWKRALDACTELVLPDETPQAS
ncbi:hypothetical protein D9758_006999 [Tetrapyrgos nigripes]|uniref:RNA-directed RNA polymerase n=1 Tax=Tetrapyrgos nigripes TaxID=182062 RepID=A0A8H5GT20_9AGAR|nr:hypothetical protein D9758_006999 [Tetrapyrgos nigripes]